MTNQIKSKQNAHDRKNERNDNTTNSIFAPCATLVLSSMRFFSRFSFTRLSVSNFLHNLQYAVWEKHKTSVQEQLHQLNRSIQKKKIEQKEKERETLFAKDSLANVSPSSAKLVIADCNEKRERKRKFRK